MLSDAKGNGVFAAIWVGTPQILNLTNSSTNAQLSGNSVYRIWSSNVCYIQFGTSNAVSATTSSHPISQALSEIVVTDGTNVWIAGIVDGVSVTAATLYVSRLSV